MRKRKIDYDSVKEKVKQKLKCIYDILKPETKYVIDASVAETWGIIERLTKMCEQHKKIVLTCVTLRELDRMQKCSNFGANNARKILSLAAEHEENFKSMDIDVNDAIPDDCIIRYCESHKRSVVLLTGDKVMAINARKKGIKTEFIKQDERVTKIKLQEKYKQKKEKEEDDGISTLYQAKLIAGNLIMTDMHTQKRSTYVRSDGKVYNQGMKELKIGDDVYIITDKIEYISLLHFKMISLKKKNHSKLVYVKNVYYPYDLSDTSGEYKPFLEEFIKEHRVS